VPKCSICLEPFDQPVSLPCTHTFCRACLLEYRAHTTADKVVTRRGVRVTCPNCRAIAMMENARRVVSIDLAPPPESIAGESKNTAGRQKRCDHKRKRLEKGQQRVELDPSNAGKA
jgi:hypothetical protein